MKVIVLANSSNHCNRCLAGIDTETGEWVRPVYNKDGSISEDLMKEKLGRLPKLLDIICIPLKKSGRDFGFQPENREVEEGDWIFCGKANIRDLDNYIENAKFILHNDESTLSPDQAGKRMPTLQLIKTKRFKVVKPKSNGRLKLRGVISPQNLDLPITDTFFTEKWAKERGRGSMNPNCFLTISLGEEFTPREGGGRPPHYKLIAGIIEIGEDQLNG